jgi:hypothetical protein
VLLLSWEIRVQQLLLPWVMQVLLLAPWASLEQSAGQQPSLVMQVV